MLPFTALLGFWIISSNFSGSSWQGHQRGLHRPQRWKTLSYCRHHERKRSCRRPVVIPKNAFAFKFIGKTLVVYHNHERKDTFGERAAKITSYQLIYRDGKEKTVSGEILGTPLALDLREGRIQCIDVVLRWNRRYWKMSSFLVTHSEALCTCVRFTYHGYVTIVRSVTRLHEIAICFITTEKGL